MKRRRRTEERWGSKGGEMGAWERGLRNVVIMKLGGGSIIKYRYDVIWRHRRWGLAPCKKRTAWLRILYEFDKVITRRIDTIQYQGYAPYIDHSAVSPCDGHLRNKNANSETNCFNRANLSMRYLWQGSLCLWRASTQRPRKEELRKKKTS